MFSILYDIKYIRPLKLGLTKNTINTFAETITNEQVLKAVSDITARARCCIQVNGGAFEYKLKKMKRRL